MEKPASPTELARSLSISVSYASEILGGQRDPSRGLAIRIYRMTGWKHDRIARLTDEEISVLERVERAA